MMRIGRAATIAAPRRKEQLMYRRILVGYNGSEQGEDALALAAQLRDAAGSVIAACIYPATGPGRGEQLEPALADAARETLVAARRRWNAGWLELEAAPGHSAAHGLHVLSEKAGTDLVVVGSSHRGHAGQVLAGTTGDRLLNGSPCPVAVAPRDYAGHASPVRTIGLAYDGSDCAAAALNEAAALASELGGTLKLITVVPPLEAVWAEDPTYTPVYSGEEIRECRRREFGRMLEAAAGPLPDELHATTMLVEGGAAERIAEEAAKGVDLLVMGSRNYGPLRRVMLGSTAIELMHKAPCAVLVIPRGAATPSASAADTTAASP
jgi:nucleotide-binding universal stress UspA family protein